MDAVEEVRIIFCTFALLALFSTFRVPSTAGLTTLSRVAPLTKNGEAVCIMTSHS